MRQCLGARDALDQTAFGDPANGAFSCAGTCTEDLHLASRSGRCCTKKACGMLEHVEFSGVRSAPCASGSTCLGIDAGATGFGTVAITSHLVVCRTRHCRTDWARPSTSLAESWPSRRADVRAPLSGHDHYPEHCRGSATHHSRAIKECTPTLETV